MSSSRFAPVQQIACTLSRRIISASDSPSSAVLIAPASVMNIFAALIEVALVAIGGVDQRRRVEVPVVMMDEIADLALIRVSARNRSDGGAGRGLLFKHGHLLRQAMERAEADAPVRDNRSARCVAIRKAFASTSTRVRRLPDHRTPASTTIGYRYRSSRNSRAADRPHRAATGRHRHLQDRAARRPSGRRNRSSRSRFSASASWFVVARHSLRRRSRPWSSATNRVRSSMWPSVSSPTMPSPSQMT